MKNLFTHILISSLILGVACTEDDPANELESIREGNNNGQASIADMGTTSPDMNDDDMDIDDMTIDVVEEPQPCLQEEQCFNTFPVQVVDSTIDGRDEWDSYGCEYQTNESGPERIYKVVLEEAGFLAAEITDLGADVDVDVHLLSKNDSTACLDRGHFSAGALLEPGTYWIAVDTWVDELGVAYPGDFELSLNLNRPSDLVDVGIDSDVAKDAMTAFSAAWGNQDTKRLEYSVIDFSLHSKVKRQWVVHLSTGELLFHLHVAHGRASIDGEDYGYSTLFSNIPESHQSSLGMIKTAESYTGDYGYSMRLDGLEVGFNDKVRPRDIVVHPWTGSTQSAVDTEGWVVPTWGCAALDPAITTEVVDRLSGGSLMFFWSPEGNWRSQSTYVNP